MADSLLHEAVRNNALWCDAVCRAHGRPGEFREGVCWLNRRETPPFYPNVVTLTDAPEVSEEQTACVRSLAGSSELPGEWAVKDSYHALDLAPLGFTVLFAGEWLYLPAGASPPPGHTAGIRWERIE
ncbi:MAG TPA: hypothetical protein VM490_18490, partial [Armatimonadaceae bacterium]|nr:hypothetical protein [Armatimonadaceae bacterium]